MSPSQAGQMPPLLPVQLLRAENGPPLPMGWKLHRLLQLQVLHEHAFLCELPDQYGMDFHTLTGQRGAALCGCLIRSRLLCGTLLFPRLHPCAPRYRLLRIPPLPDE